MFDLPHDEVHLWESSLSVDDSELARILDLLSPVDRWAADEFSHVPARKQYIVSRGMLRQLLSGYIGIAPQEIQFTIEGAGKPVLAGERSVDFNLTHSGDLTLLGVARRPLGVDMERVREMPRAIELAKRYYSPAQHEEIAATPDDTRSRRFLGMWVRREAYAKALGTSVWRALGDRQITTDHTVQFVDYSAEYVAAIAAPGNDWKIVRCGAIPSPKYRVL
ncbi:MAG: 4'-phosphopantetheinyl transferase superfamily protein [Gemmatimonadota bacterium]|nr:4'-phosphopantetheinyl transferase superfamily protein [Gemmatimonadota bacterium]